jgi:hypothetical protein
MSNPRDREKEKEWKESTIDARDPALLIRELSAKVGRFDQKIFWRNFREYAAGLVVLVWAGYRALQGNRPSIGMVVGIVFVLAYLSWQHRKLRPLDPSADVGAYRKALLERFDDQIRLLSRVKYWYLLPLYLPVVWMTVELWPRGPWAAGTGLAVVTAVFTSLGWLNERYAVRNLEKARAQLKAMAEEEES